MSSSKQQTNDVMHLSDTQLQHAMCWPSCVPLDVRASHIAWVRRVYQKYVAQQHKDADEHRVFMVGLTGGVSAGKTTSANMLQAALSVLLPSKRTICLSTDHFLYDNAEIARRVGMHQKGFPKSYRFDALYDFVKACRARASAHYDLPKYTHATYDIDQATQMVAQPDVLIVEGVIALQPHPQNAKRRLTDLWDMSIYLEVEAHLLETWFMARFEALRHSAQPGTFYHQWATLSPDAARDLALNAWQCINVPNYEQHIAPSKKFADMVLTKSATHAVQSIEEP